MLNHNYKDTIAEIEEYTGRLDIAKDRIANHETLLKIHKVAHSNRRLTGLTSEQKTFKDTTKLKQKELLVESELEFNKYNARIPMYKRKLDRYREILDKLELMGLSLAPEWGADAEL